jgi:VCBS repeat-containing protein
MDETAALAAFHEAVTEPNHVHAILAVLDTYRATILEGEAYEADFNELLKGGVRQQAIAQGLYEEWALSGNFGSMGLLKLMLGEQVHFEHAKHQFVTAVNSAANPNAMADAIALHAPALSEHRQNQIRRLVGMGDDPNVRARIEELQKDPYTIVLDKITGRPADTGFLNDLAAGLLTARDPKGAFNDVLPIITALDLASVASDAALFAAFNDAADWNPMLAAIHENASTVLDGTSTSTLQMLPDGGEREEAIGVALIEIRTLFGPFEGVNEFRDAVNQQIAVERAKHEFVQAIDNADDADGIASALEQVIILNTDRQNQIARWSNSSDPVVVSRAEALKGEAYTIVLKEIEARLNDEAFMADLSGRLLSARDAIPGDKTFSSIVKIISAIDTAADAINSPTAPADQKVLTDEDAALVEVAIGASDPDGDALTYKIKENAGPQKGTVILSDGKFTYTPDRNVSGSDRFTIANSDGTHGTAEQKVSVVINAVNDAPAEVSLSKDEVVENSKRGTEIGQLTAGDADGDPLTFTLLDNAGERFELQVVNGATSLVVKEGSRLDYEQATSHRIKVQVKDAANATYEETFTIQVENATDETLTGTPFADVLKGNAGKDTLQGGSGDDKLWGGLSNDTLSGDKGKDVFVFDTKAHKSTNRDKILDFKVTDDAIWLDNAIFTKLGKKGTEDKPAQMKKEFFLVGSKAKDKNDYLVYDKAKGVLSYDADGSGKGKAVEIASLSKKLAITYKDFFVI